MKAFSKPVKTALLCALALCILLFSCLFAYPASNRRGEQLPQEYAGILRLWHIDSFEGGVGSRAAFLRGAAKIFEKKYGIYVLITVHTPASAAVAAQDGLPDLLSYGTYLDFAAEIAQPLGGEKFPFATAGGKGYALPWCRGNYFLFTRDGDFSDVSESNTLFSDGGTLMDAAAYTAGLTGNFPVMQSTAAYVQFLNGKYKYMLGTQRDLFRFRTRKAEVQAKALSSFCDLYQYLSILSEEEGKKSAAENFIACVLSEEVQEKLPQIGMLSVSREVYGAEEPALQAAQSVLPERGVNVFLSEKTRKELFSLSEAARKGDKNSAKILENILS